MNIELLNKVKAHILEEPKRLDMSVILRRAPRNACGTAGCVDGWAQVLSNCAALGSLVFFDGDYVKGRELLGLTQEEAERLFSDPKDGYDEDHVEYAENGWPEEFIDRYRKARNASQRAIVTVERIDHFIKTKGAE